MKTITTNRIRHHARRGSLVIDAVVALALLSTAFISLGKLASSSAALSLNSDQRLAATLAGENVIERLRAVGIESLADDAAKAGLLVEQATGFDVQIEMKPFQLDKREAVHLTVVVQVTQDVAVTIHDWRVAPAETDAQSEVDDE